ncbi:unnamed protein product (macronuclear) [Paramecium tetraurelia]|uniref:Mitochondrial import inner membrane translocase subunit TIM50 n=1 Tax=Paramecium tetraurelia TaxID=5888 RepID=A0CB64_PARTE|nr:uncharacterized protein GSPATT00036814001 [Paramecium tetraurelia]CAK68031.1 unnamed protein product [Paramecium tetraurelia]|eukprot:XP_001435428.1 hypothetical protein (macronuclear) [Paramecium tetraurelia strain d4-2]
MNILKESSKRITFQLRHQKLFIQKKVLVLDLDETLVHLNSRKMKIFNMKLFLNILKVRPYLNQFLLEASKDYEIFIFIAGYEDYCQEVLGFIDKKKQLLTILQEEAVTLQMGFVIKIYYQSIGLWKIQYSLIIIQMLLQSTRIMDYSNDDDCLLKLLLFLKYMAKKIDVRPVEQYLRNYEDKIGTTVFSEAKKSIQLEQEEPDEDTLSEGKVVKRDQEVTDLDIKNKKSQTQQEIANKVKIHTLSDLQLFDCL